MDIEISTLFVSFINFFLGIFIYLKNKKSLVNRSFCVFSVILGIWALSLYFYSHPIIFSAFVWIKIVYFVGTFPMGISLLYFSYIFPEGSKKLFPEKIFFLWGLISTPFIYLLLFTNLWVKKVVLKPWGYETITGPAYIFVALYSTLLIGWMVYNFVRKYLTANKVLKNQLGYIFLGIFLFVITVAVIDVIIPLLFHTSRFFGISPVSSLFLIGFTALAITRYHLFEVRVILTELLVGAIAIISFIQALLAKTLGMRVLGFGVFLLFCIFGYLLIKATYREIEKREEVERLYEELQKLDKAKSEFISIASHQLRTPVSIIRGMLSMLATGELKEKIKEEFIKKAFSTSNRLERLISDLLNATRLEEKKMEMKLETTQIDDVIKEVIKELEPIAKEKGLMLKYIKIEDLPTVMVDSRQIKEVISNLVDNALRYTFEGSVEVGTKREKNQLIVSVKDKGIGITDSEKERLFQKFFRSERAIQKEANGSGLGLFVAQKIAETHNGKVEAESEGEGKGSTFKLILPLPRGK